MHFVAIASSLLFASSLTLTFADAAAARFDGTEIASSSDSDDDVAPQASDGLEPKQEDRRD
jgi:hypothetical protein